MFRATRVSTDPSREQDVVRERARCRRRPRSSRYHGAGRIRAGCTCISWAPVGSPMFDSTAEIQAGVASRCDGRALPFRDGKGRTCFPPTTRTILHRIGCTDGASNHHYVFVSHDLALAGPGSKFAIRWTYQIAKTLSLGERSVTY